MGVETGQERATERLGVVAVQLIEAARYAWDGDRDSAKARICRALTLLGTALASAAVPRHAAQPPTSTRHHGFIRGGLAPFQARRLVEHIDAHLAERITLHQLARMAGLSTGHFSRAFKQTFGVPTHTYLIRRRVQRAQSVMLSTQLPLSDIALACGLSDQSHFTRMFRRIVGETPNAWRRAHRDALDHAPAASSHVPGISHDTQTHCDTAAIQESEIAA
jgi:AraC-like DNA-binding protein